MLYYDNWTRFKNDNKSLVTVLQWYIMTEQINSLDTKKLHYIQNLWFWLKRETKPNP